MANTTLENEPKRIYRSKKDRMLGGVCGGIAEYTNIDPSLVRIAFVLVTIFFGLGILIYPIMWIVVPEQP